MYEDEADCKNLAEWRHIDIDSIYNTITVRNCDQAFNEFATYLGEEVFCLNFFDNRTNIFAKEACCEYFLFLCNVLIELMAYFISLI